MNPLQYRQRVLRAIDVFFAATAVIVAIALPTLYYLEDASGEQDELEAFAQFKAEWIAATLARNPASWPSAGPQLLANTANHTPDDDDDVTVQSLLDTDLTVIAKDATTVLRWPIATETVELVGSNGLLGYYRVERSLEKLLRETLYVTLGSLMLAFLIAFPLRTLPLRALRKAFRELEEEKEKALITLQSIGDAVITTDAAMTVEYLNPIAEKLTGWTTEQARGLPMNTVFKIFNEITGEPATNPIQECLETNSIVEMENHTILIRRTDGEELHIEDSAAPIRRSDGTVVGAVMVFHDVTERKAAQKQLHHIAFHDELTALPNRSLFQKELVSAMHDARLHGKHVGVLFMDLDRFKTINDSLGHGVGDDLLIMVAGRLRSCVRSHDTVSRMGGDEFTAVLKDLNTPDNARSVAEKIIAAFSDPFIVAGQELKMSTSIGITIYPDDGSDIDQLLKNADIAMYYAKSRGRNNFQCYLPSMNVAAVERLQLENALHSAFAKNEMFLEYQPKFSLKTNRIIGAEALLRWEHSKRGRIPPSEFIPLLEDSGDIIRVGHWVWQTAIRQAKAWLNSGYPLEVSVNASALQFGREGLVEQVASMLAVADLPPELLRIEVTESLLMEDSDHNELLMRKLVDLGVGISLDDFGTGYSSLSYLRRFPISELKIDRSFISDISGNESAHKVVNTIIDLGQALNMTVTAEGVETEEQRLQLSEMGCDAIQGHLLSKALDVEAFSTLLESHQPATGDVQSKAGIGVELEPMI